MTKIRPTVTKPARLALLSVMTASCASQVGPEFDAENEPVAWAQGALTLAGPANEANETIDADVAILWQVGLADDLAPGTLVNVSGSAPVSFSLGLPPPPPTALRREIDWENQVVDPGMRVAVGYIAAIQPGTLNSRETTRPDFMGDTIMGWADGYAVAYAAEDVPAGSVLAEYFCGPMTAGYHLLQGESAPNGDDASCPSGDAAWVQVPDGLTKLLSIDLCSDEFSACAEDPNAPTEEDEAFEEDDTIGQQSPDDSDLECVLRTPIPSQSGNSGPSAPDTTPGSLSVACTCDDIERPDVSCDSDTTEHWSCGAFGGECAWVLNCCNE